MDVTQLVQLEEAAWASQATRELYCTPIVPSFPWYTVVAQGPSLPRRHVVPYLYTFRVFVKGRWAGRSLLDVYSEEHAHHSREYYKACIQQGRLRRQPRVHCNVRRSCMKRSHGVDVSPIEEVESNKDSVLLQQGDIVLHTIHRHEVPMCVGVTGVDPIFIAAVRITEYGILVVHKPSGVPTHASGRYFMNSCTAMLEYVLTPKRLRAWLLQRDPLLQSIVSTSCLSELECQELLAYYGNEVRDEKATDEFVDTCRLPRPCHRLDKVTSGVLIFGVSHAAARRVGTALASKTKQMEDVIFPLLLQLGQMEAANMKGVSVINGATLEEFSTCVRKRYLARVHGHFPKCVLQRVRSRGSCSGNVSRHDNNDTNTTTNNNNSDSGRREGRKDIFIAATPEDIIRKDDNHFEAHTSDIGPTVVFASPVPQLKFCDADVSNESPRDSNEKSLREFFYQEAATLCQPLHYYGTSGEGNEGSSLIQCVPFTGRKHQIRMHVSHWGHPIIGDDSCISEREEEEEQQQSRGTSAAEVDVTRLYFSEEDLPASYRKHFYTHDELCWECARRLPVATFGSRNRDAITLHAWQYEIDHELLVGGKYPGETDSAPKLEHNEKKKCRTSIQELQKTRDSSPGLFCNLVDVLQQQTEFVRRQGASVIFSAPPPPWSLQ